MTRRWKPARSGTCRVCGCTDERACDGGCEWVDRHDTLCSRCAGTLGDVEWTLAAFLQSQRGRKVLRMGPLARVVDFPRAGDWRMELFDTIPKLLARIRKRRKDDHDG